MFHKVKNVWPIEDYKLTVQFCEGCTKTFDVKPLIKQRKEFKQLKDKDTFNNVHVGPGGYGIIWNEEIDLACDYLYEKGITIKTVFDDLMSFKDATTIWGLNESTLRKAVQYGKLKNGIDVIKYGKQWVIDINAMKREYGEAPDLNSY